MSAAMSVAGTPGPSAAPHVAPRATRERWATPRTLRLYLALIWLGAAVVSIVGWRTLVRVREAIQTIGHDTAPTIMAAQEVGATFADLDANEASYLLLTDPVARDQATQLFEFRRAEATKRLVEAAGNTALGDAQRVPIVLMFENLGRYLEVAARARQLADRGDAQGAVDAYRIATDIMHARILVDADVLDAANRTAMDDRYVTEQRGSAGMEGVAVFLGVLLTVILVASQLFIAVRMRRLVNVPLLFATIVTIAFTADLSRRIGDAREDLRVAKEDAFESIHILWKTRAKAYDARGDETRGLVDRAHADSWGASYAASVAELTSAPVAPVLPLLPGQRASFDGLIAKELSNITFAGEGDAALAMVESFKAYYLLDSQIRASEAAGRHPDAVQLCLGPSHDAFDKFDSAALRTLDINKNVFDQVIADGEHVLGTAAWLDPALALFIALAAWLGIRPRLREYTSA